MLSKYSTPSLYCRLKTPLLLPHQQAASGMDDPMVYCSLSSQNAKTLQPEGLHKIVQAEHIGAAFVAPQEVIMDEQAEEYGQQPEELGLEEVCAIWFNVQGEHHQGGEQLQVCC